MADYKSPGVYVEVVPPIARPIAGVGTSTPGFIGILANTIQLPARTREGDEVDDINRGFKFVDFSVPAAADRPYFITNWSQFINLFGDFTGLETLSKTTETGPTINSNQRNLAHAIFGFFNNGGTGCYVLRITGAENLRRAVNVFAAIDDITIVAAPGLIDTEPYNTLIAHCNRLQDRVAILDPPETATDFNSGDFRALETSVTAPEPGLRPPDSDYAAFYFPWLQVFDPAERLMNPSGDGLIYVPPSGHLAGIYARNDSTRGVFKAPANEPVLGVTGLRYNLSKADQDKLNPLGVNLIRSLNGAIRVWGARTVGGDNNGEFKYLSTRRYFNFLRESIDKGTQFAVFEPHTPALWQRIKRSVSDFLLNQWREGALFGETPQQAFFVKCDAETNPPEVRQLGRVITEIGVAIVQPAEFVIFRIQQTTGG
jgi:phage tail sheath protein FI